MAQKWNPSREHKRVVLPMKNCRFRLILLLIPALFAAGTASSRTLPGPESLGDVHYDVRYRIAGMTTQVATATISWEEVEWERQEAFHSAAIIRTAPLFRLFLKAEYTADTYFSRKGFSPLYFINPFKEGGKEGKIEYWYHPDKGVIESLAFWGQGQSESTTFPDDGRTMDLLSLVHFIRFQDFPADAAPLEVQLLMSGHSYPARLVYQGKDDEKFAEIPAEKILLEMTNHGLMENGSGNEIHLWRAATPDHRLLALEVALSSGEMSCTIQQ